MPQITLSVPNEKLPLLREFLQALGVRENGVDTIYEKSISKSKQDRNGRTSFRSYLKPFFNWEFFRNELEFE